MEFDNGGFTEKEKEEMGNFYDAKLYDGQKIGELLKEEVHLHYPPIFLISNPTKPKQYPEIYKSWNLGDKNYETKRETGNYTL